MAVGHLRKHADYEVQNLSIRIVKVWKAQLAEHKKQKQSAISKRTSR